MSIIIWHNPRCSKSRQTLALIEEKGEIPKIRLYLEDPPSVADIKSVLTLLRVTPRDLMRKGEAEYKDQGLADVADEEALVAAMAASPKLIERPVVIKGAKAVLGRPPENVLSLF